MTTDINKQHSDRHCHGLHDGTSCISLVPIFNHLDYQQMCEIMQAISRKLADLEDLGLIKRLSYKK